MKQIKQILVGLLALAAFMVYLPSPGAHEASAASPGSVDAPLLTCGDINANGPVDGGDFFAVLGKFNISLPNPAFQYLYDLNADNSIAGGDFFAVLGDFGQTCPTVDTQVALATRWGLGLATPASCSSGNASPPLTETVAAIEAVGYYRGSTDVPGQGVHYFKPELWDGVFDPCRPEGLVYSGGVLVAQLYVINGDAGNIGWNGWDPPFCPDPGCATAMTGAQLDSFCSPSPCTWNSTEVWHAHANLCTGYVGTTSAFALPGQSLSACDTGTGSQPLCTTPVTTQPCYMWNHRVGWMSHLWNHDLNENLIPDTGGPNGRFADCAPPSKQPGCPM